MLCHSPMAAATRAKGAEKTALWVAARSTCSTLHDSRSGSSVKTSLGVAKPSCTSAPAMHASAKPNSTRNTDRIIPHPPTSILLGKPIVTSAWAQWSKLQFLNLRPPIGPAGASRLLYRIAVRHDAMQHHGL